MSILQSVVANAAFKNYLKRPWLPAPKECLLFTTKAIEVFGEQYILTYVTEEEI